MISINELWLGDTNMLCDKDYHDGISLLNFLQWDWVSVCQQVSSSPFYMVATTAATFIIIISISGGS